MFKRFRRCYFFGYGADSEPELIHAVTGHKPRVLGPAVLQDYELRIQDLHDVTTAGVNPKRILTNAWGPRFKSYVIVGKEGASVRGTLYRISLIDRHMIDRWELVSEGWYDKLFITVTMLDTRKIFQAETQVLAPGQRAAHDVADAHNYPSWLMPKKQLVEFAMGEQWRTPPVITSA